MNEAGDGAYLGYTEFALPVKIQSRPNEPINIFVGEKLVGKMIHTEAVPNGRPSGYWLADDEGESITTHFLETRFDVAVGELLMSKGYVDEVRAFLMFDKRYGTPPATTAAYVLPDRDPEIEPSGLTPGLAGVGIGIAVAIMIFVIGRIFL